ncbi:MAG: glycosyltransferase family 1 protein [Aquificae bacterium]|nr:glycosyltransferase family 1 protein [Aquificota bacterium]
MKPRVALLQTPDKRGFIPVIMEGLEKAFSAKNFEAKIIELNPENVQQVVEELNEFRPLFMFDINLDGVIFGEQDGKKIPLADMVGNVHITWFLEDPMLHYTKIKEVKDSNQFLYLTIDIDHMQWINTEFRKNASLVTPGVNPSAYPPANVKKEFDVAFVGPVVDPTIIEASWKERFDEPLYVYAIELGRLLYRNPDMPIRIAANYLGSQFNEEFQKALLKFKQERDEEYYRYLIDIGVYAMHLRRWNIIDSIEDFEVNILGPAQGEFKDNIVIYDNIINENDIITFLSKSKISLISQPPFIPSGTGFTVFNSVASGALTMVEERLSVKTFFNPDQEIVLYHPIDTVEIEGKIAYFLEEKPKELEAIAKAGRDRVFREHTLYQRGEFIASLMEEILKSAEQASQTENKEESVETASKSSEETNKDN